MTWHRQAAKQHKMKHDVARRITMCLFAALMALPAVAQRTTVELTGTVGNERNEPVPFASVYVHETMTGTATDANGEFSMLIPIDSTLIVSVQHVGYVIETRTIHATEDIHLAITLTQGTVLIDEVTARADVDMATIVMRKAIAFAPLHLDEVTSYTAGLYMKGSVVFDKIPKIVAGRMGDKLPETGRTYTTESFNEIEYIKPNKYKHTIILEHSSIPGYIINDGAKLRYRYLNLYNINNDDWLISPLSPRAFSYYKFRYKGFTTAFGRIVNQIEVIPRYQSKQLFSGTIHIVDGVWRLAYVDLKLETAIGTIAFVQHFIPFDNEVWLPVQQSSQVDVSVIGVKGKMNYVGVLDYYDMKYEAKEQSIATIVAPEAEADPASESDKLRHAQSQRMAKKITKVLEKDELAKSDIRKVGRYWRRFNAATDTTRNPLETTDRIDYTIIDVGAEEGQSISWADMRPLELTRDEADGFAIALDEQVDTLKKNIRAANPSKSTSFLLSALGSTSFRLGDSMSIWISGIGANTINFHPVTGFALEQSAAFRHVTKKFTWSAGTRLSYAIAPRRIAPELNASIEFAHHSVSAQAGQGYADWKDPVGDSRLTNTFTTLFLKRNYKNLVYKRYASARYSGEPLWGFRIKAAIEAQEIETVENMSNFSIFRPNAEYGNNTPGNKRIADASVIGDATQVTSTLSLSHTPRLRYYTDKNGRRVPYGSRWPTFEVSITRGMGMMGNSKSNFAHTNVHIYHKKRFSLSDRFNWDVTAGKLFNAERANFVNWKHFAGSDKVVAFADLATGYRGFVTFKPYELSTNDWYAGASMHFQSQSLIIKKIPFLSNWLYTEEIYLKTLLVGEDDLYSEIGYGLGHILLVLRLSAFASFHNDNFKSVCFRMAISLGELLGQR